MPSRRQLLAAVSTGVASTAGCLGSLPSDADVRLCVVEVRNRLPDAREVRLRVHADDQTVFADEFTVVAQTTARVDLPVELPPALSVERPDDLGLELSIEGLSGPARIDLLEESTVGQTWLEPAFEVGPEAELLTEVGSTSDC
ncbi:hypothetical protein [Haloarchaeobius sp. FL176]|uniref:hypothetical protein n=1 Tax=Haloarchaeobius sp. FL176 TaxID=2967129 RepID=UPI00214795B5|nr:hypothetical protein [Haloarchaeobius sp. FL176]